MSESQWDADQFPWMIEGVVSKLLLTVQQWDELSFIPSIG
jgi:hypothetical protein